MIFCVAFRALQKLLEEAVASGGAAKNDAGRLAAELEESQKGNRALRAEVNGCGIPSVSLFWDWWRSGGDGVGPGEDFLRH